MVILDLSHNTRMMAVINKANRNFGLRLHQQSLGYEEPWGCLDVSRSCSATRDNEARAKMPAPTEIM